LSNHSNIAILIPAAGNSSRLGTPKQLLKWKGSTLLAHTIKTAQQLHCEQIFLVLGSDLDAISSSVEEFQITLLNNKQWKTGLGGSIAFGIKHIIEIELEVDGVLIMLPDQPLIDLDHFKAMTDYFESGQDQIIATKYGNDKKGVPALFDRKYFNELGELTNDLGAKYLLNKYSENVQVLESTQTLLDIDTMDDYKKLYRANHQ
jgi:molybdenum cofactor cytidylyltransferase